MHLGEYNHHNLSNPVPHSDPTYTIVDELRPSSVSLVDCPSCINIDHKHMSIRQHVTIVIDHW